MQTVGCTSNITVRRGIGVCVSILLLATPLSGYAQSKTFGQYTVHYSAFTADLLTPTVAKEYRIPRSKNRAILNISILKNKADGVTQPSYAELKITAANLSQQLRTLKAREIASKDSVYYIAATPISNAEVLQYNIEILPEGEVKPYTFSFSEVFYTD